MAALRSSFASLNLSSNSFLGQTFAPSFHLPVVRLQSPFFPVSLIDIMNYEFPYELLQFSGFYPWGLLFLLFIALIWWSYSWNWSNIKRVFWLLTRVSLSSRICKDSPCIRTVCVYLYPCFLEIFNIRPYAAVLCYDIYLKDNEMLKEMNLGMAHSVRVVGVLVDSKS